jgi:hypothetical protein
MDSLTKQLVYDTENRCVIGTCDTLGCLVIVFNFGQTVGDVQLDLTRKFLSLPVVRQISIVAENLSEPNMIGKHRFSWTCARDLDAPISITDYPNLYMLDHNASFIDVDPYYEHFKAQNILC